MKYKEFPTQADLVSLSRIPLAFLFFYFFDQVLVASLVLLTGWLSDVVDGMLAKSTGKSRYGGQIDAATDKFFTLSVVIILLYAGAITLQQTLILVMRDLFVVLLWFSALSVAKKRKIKYLQSVPDAKLSGKVTTGLQFVVILAAFSGSMNLEFLFYVLFVSAIVTITDYTLVFIHRLRETKVPKKA